MPVRVTMGFDDPLARAIAPPADESPEARAERLEREAEAKRVSDLIDEELARERAAQKKVGKPVKILLLGQSESGKSTTLKNFQLMNSPKAFRAERSSWRAVIQLNVVRSIRLILDAMMEAPMSRSSTPTPSSPWMSAQTSSPSPAVEDLPPLTAEHLKLRKRLLPLLAIEESLLHKLAEPDSMEFEAVRLAPLTNRDLSQRRKELSVNSSSTWKGAFSKILTPSIRGSMESAAIDWEDPEDPGRILTACGEDMIALWTDPAIQALLNAQRLRLEEMPGFFLDCLDRVTSPRYVPSDDDILRARLKTLGVTEYKFSINTAALSRSMNNDWRIYDVGGQRSMRSAWVPFFDDMDAIIFLAPISCFDQVLAEDSAVNRLEDSVLLWKAIVSNQLLASTSIILFLNKCDILKAKLQSGVQLGKYIISYGDRPNDFESAATYLRRKFAQIMKDHSTEPRQFMCYFTSVTDTKATKLILQGVQDLAIRANLRGVSLL